ncbi:MAG: peptide deformylase [Acidimicrobiales bacterium]
MAVRTVLTLGHPVLAAVSIAIGELGGWTKELAIDLVDTMRASPGCVGLAAPQIGVGVRAMAVDVTGHPKARSCHGEFVLFNPEVIRSGDPVSAREGCMSVPDLTGTVTRAAAVVISGTSPQGDHVVLHADQFEARAILHEIDHLDGLVFLDRVASAEAIFRRKTYQ